MLAHIVNGVLRTKVSEEIIYTKEYCVHWNSWLIRPRATVDRHMEECLFVITWHMKCKIRSWVFNFTWSIPELCVFGRAMCFCLLFFISLPAKSQWWQRFVCSDQNKCGRGGLEGLPVRRQGGGCLLVVVVEGGVRKWQASRLVRMTNGQTGVTTGQSADPLVPLCLSGGISMDVGLAGGPFLPLRGETWDSGL